MRVLCSLLCLLVSFLRYDNEANQKVERERNSRSKYMLRNRALLRDSLEVLAFGGFV